MTLRTFALSLSFAVMAMVSSLKAHKPFYLDSHHVKTVAVSSEGLTRISVEGEAITEMFAYPGDLGNSLNLHESGHLFVAPAGIAEPIYLTVMTSEGRTQDLKLSFVKKKPEPILIVPQKDVVVSESQLKKWLSVALLKEVPRGFRRESISQDPRINRRVTKDTIATECDRYSNGHYTLVVYEIVARHRMPLALTPASSHKTQKAEQSTLTLSTDMYLSDEEAGLVSTPFVNCEHQKAFLAVISKNS